MGRPNEASFKAIRTGFNVPIYRMVFPMSSEPFWKWPAKQGGNKAELEATGLKCSYHREYGHRTEDCRMYKQYLEELVEAGHLKQYLAQPNARNQRNVQMVDEGDDSGADPPPAGHIRVIHGGKECAPFKEARSEMRKKASDHHVMHLGQKRPREDGERSCQFLSLTKIWKESRWRTMMPWSSR